ncbi:hypothetical protein HDV57DRAFT_225456 [Trichoderma longibrachiatum]
MKDTRLYTNTAASFLGFRPRISYGYPILRTFFFRLIFLCPEHGSGAMTGFLFFSLPFLFSVIQKTDFFPRATCTTTQCTRGGEDRDTGHFSI